MEFIYDGESLPMISAKGETFRVQILNHGKWESLESEQAYENFFNDCDVIE